MEEQSHSYSWNKDELSVASDDSTEVESPVQPCATNGSTDLRALDIAQLKQQITKLNANVDTVSGRLIDSLGKRDHLTSKLLQKFDVLTAILKSLSLNIKGASTLRFSLAPQGGPDGFRPWLSAWKVVSRVGSGVSVQWRRDLWSAMVHYRLSHLDWGSILPEVFSSNKTEEDRQWDVKIKKDLLSCGAAECADPLDERRMGRVLLAYARFNTSVGYCQGFNIIAMVILRVTNGDEELSFKVLVYLIDHVFPKDFFTHKLEGLSVDIAVFRDLIAFYLPELSGHLEMIREAASKSMQAVTMNSFSSSGGDGEDNVDSGSVLYEPPLTNLFTMQWFLTLYATVLPRETALRVWDAILLEGSEVVFYTALVLWRLFQSDLLTVETAADFYQTMSLLSAHLKKGKIVNTKEFMELLYLYIDEVDNCDFHTLPSPKDLRERYTYSIVPLATEQPSHSRALGTIRDFFKGKTAKHTPRLCPPPSRGASLLPSWKFRLPQAKLVAKDKPPQLHIDQRKRKVALSLPFASATSSGDRKGVVLDSAAAELSPVFPQQSIDLDSILYTMEISDHLHSYSAQRATVLPQVSSSPVSESTSPGSITNGKSPRRDHYRQTLPRASDPASVSAHAPKQVGSVPYSSVGELANLLITQEQ